MDSSEWFDSYYQTYLQKDVKEIVNVSDTNQFDRFVRLSAGRIGTLTTIARSLRMSVSQPTAVRWSSVLESASFCSAYKPILIILVSG